MVGTLSSRHVLALTYSNMPDPYMPVNVHISLTPTSTAVRTQHATARACTPRACTSTGMYQYRAKTSTGPRPVQGQDQTRIRPVSVQDQIRPGSDRSDTVRHGQGQTRSRSDTVRQGQTGPDRARTGQTVPDQSVHDQYCK